MQDSQQRVKNRKSDKDLISYIRNIDNNKSYHALERYSKQKKDWKKIVKNIKHVQT